MSLPIDGNLVWILEPLLQCKEDSSQSSELILVEHIVSAGLCGLSGGRAKEIGHFIDCPPRAVYLARDDFIDALNDVPALNIHLPKSMQE